jgi:hypothetical protein
MKTREELEDLINGSSLFLIDRVKDKECFEIEKDKFLYYIAKLMEIIHKKTFKNIGYEIIIVARDCIKSYKAECGPFLNYFNTALKKKLLTEKAKEMANKHRGGMTLDEKTEQTIRQIVKYAKARNENIYNIGFAKKASDALGIPLQKIEEMIAINYNITTQSGNNYILDKDGNSSELFEFITDTTETTEGIVKFDAVREIVISIDVIFKEQQERIKPLLKKLLTARLIKTLEEISAIEEDTQKLTFFDKDIYLDYIKLGKIPTAREIADEFERDEASVSRTLKKFLEKIPRKC